MKRNSSYPVVFFAIVFNFILLYSLLGHFSHIQQKNSGYHSVPISNTFHVVAMPFPGRGHVNSLMNFCKLIAKSRPNILITFIVTEDWHGFLSSGSKPENIHYGVIPNVIPSEIGRAKDVLGFFEAVSTKLEAPVERLLDQLQPPYKPRVIISDTYLAWMVRLGDRRNITVASFWSASATVFSIFHHFELLVQNGHFRVNLTERGEELINYIPGIPSMRVADLPTQINGKGQETLQKVIQTIRVVPKAQYLLVATIYELEAQVIDTLREKFPIPIHTIGPSIPYLDIKDSFSSTLNRTKPHYIQWLDAQPKGSVLYISQGSFHSLSSNQLDEIFDGVQDSRVRFFLVDRENAARSHGGRNNNSSRKGLVVPWCDQLKVLHHPSVGGFLSHGGWNSVKESVFVGIPILAFPIFGDQATTSKQIMEDWKVGWRVIRRNYDGLVTKEEISRLLQKFMNIRSNEGKRMRKTSHQHQEICQRAIGDGGSSELDVNAFLKKISELRHY